MSKNAATQVTKSTYSYNTIYYGDGSVRVLLESSLPRAFFPEESAFSSKESYAGDRIHRSIVLKIRGSFTPRPVFELVDEGGEILFSQSDIDKLQFVQNTLARWFYQNDQDSLKRYIDETTSKEVDAEVRNGQLVIRRSDWQEMTDRHPKPLAGAKVAIVLP